jgi:hypothetical protein
MLQEMRKLAPWLWVNCLNVRCLHRAPTALAPLIIRGGEHASSDVLRHSAKCSRCGRKGASLTTPSWEGLDTGFASFPVEYVSGV